MLSSSKQRLPHVLLSFQQKLAALFLQRLVLNDTYSDSGSDVIEYDHHCQGAQIILDFLKTRKQAILLKAFTQIRVHQPGRPKATSKNQTINNTTRRTFLNTTFSDNSPVRQINSFTAKSKQQDSSELNNSKLNNSKVDMQKLLNRVRMATSRTEGSYSFRQAPNMSYYEPSYRENNSFCYQRYIQTPTAHYSRVQQRYRQHPTFSGQLTANHSSQMLNKKNSRRQFIMNKFNHIENTLHTMGDERGRSRLGSQILGEIHSIKERLRL